MLRAPGPQLTAAVFFGNVRPRFTGEAIHLGTAASPGNNTLTGNQPTQLSVRVADAVAVSAVGNTWMASQGADEDGHYTVDGDLCMGDDPCDQTSGADVNFTFTFTGAGAGAVLRLAGE